MKFEKQENQIIIKVPAAYPISNWEAVFVCSHPMSKPYQELLYENLTKNFCDHLSTLRQIYYKMGWKDAKAHKTKIAWEPGAWRESE